MDKFAIKISDCKEIDKTGPNQVDLSITRNGVQWNTQTFTKEELRKISEEITNFLNKYSW